MQKDTTTSDTADAINEFSKDVEATVKTIFETTRAATSKALKATQEKIEEAYEENEDAINQGVRRSVDLIKQYPLESAIACLGVGFLIGKLLGRQK